MAKHIQTGKRGEALGCNWLKLHNYEIINRNWRTGNWEIDVIAHKNKTLHFIEIKTRKASRGLHPEENVSYKKLQNMLFAAEVYLYENPQWTKIQFDILAITFSAKQPIEYYLIEDISEG
ncbi:MAG: hypothetical protein RLY16_1810 [Bacteroidota bacterium]|jgi:putative endonuclease